MGEAVNRLMEYQSRDDCYTVPFAEVRDLQIAAMNEQLQERIDKIRLVGFRAEESGVSEIRDYSDVVPLLLPHTAYKSYPESFLIDEKWDKLTKWLGTVSAYPVGDTDLEGIGDVDEWIERLEQAGHPVSCSSGTTGKSAMLIASDADLEWTAWDSVVACAWGTGIKPAQDRHVFSMAPVAAVPRNLRIMEKLHEAFGKPDSELFRYPVPPITVGSITRMIALRKAIAEGTAKPREIAEYEQTGAAREKALDDAIGITVDALIKVRGEKLFLTGLWGNLYKVAVAMRERGYSGKDFHPENMMYVGGGLKREQLPPDYREFVRETFNIEEGRNFQLYGMQELGSVQVRCNKGGRYHTPPWLVCLPLNKDADALLPMDQGEVQCRAGFFDLSLDGRWGGVISGDRMEIDFGPCECGAQTPSVRDNIVRYADLEGDDKIGCAGTIDAYVRGMS
ncbi:MAG: hypothetical protein R3E09_12420 [Novosphingobium sp.]|nr:hypothetical protein [Novosphingobium sp.]